jgi:DNA-binding MarR family transcriptional regulator
VPESDVSGETDVPDDVRTLLRTRIETYEQIEVLRILQSDPQREWTSAELGEQLHLAPQFVEIALEALDAREFVRRSARGIGRRSRYSPANAEIKASVERLLHEYRERPLRVIQLISAYAIERVRTGALRAFAEAFVLKKDRDRG